MAKFNFITVWQIQAPLSRVCDVISCCEQWPQWWESVESVEEFDTGDAEGIGSLKRFTWRGILPYRLVFDMRVTRIVPLTILEGQASGEVEGIGCWHFSSSGDITEVRYEWRVNTNRLWMNIIAPLARPIFKWNHDQVMRQGAEGLARFLDARLVSLTHG